MFFIYKPTSAFRRIARELGVSVWYPYHDRIIHRNRVMSANVNIGCVRLEQREGMILNADLSIAVSKKRTFEALDGEGIRHPPVFATPEEAAQWEHGWLGRRDGLSGGRGITIFEHGQLPLQAAQFDLCVGIIPKIAEYRIHVGRLPGEEHKVLAEQQKLGVYQSATIINNFSNGTTFSIQELRMSRSGKERARTMAIRATSACGLDFAAVDLVQGADHTLYLLECNTAPGIRTPKLFDIYLEFFRNLII